MSKVIRVLAGLQAPFHKKKMKNENMIPANILGQSRLKESVFSPEHEKDAAKLLYLSPVEFELVFMLAGGLTLINCCMC